MNCCFVLLLNLEAGIYFIVGTNDTDLIKKKIVVSK